MTVEDAKGKVVEFTKNEGNTTAYAYMANEGEKVDGSNFDKFEVIVGTENFSNNLIAGNGDSSLIGNSGDNILQGGAGQDNFICSVGNTLIKNY